MDVSMSPKNFDQEKVITLVCHIAKMYPNEPALFVRVFDSLRAAKAYVPGGEDHAGISYRGMYSYYDPDFEQHLSWRPDREDRYRSVEIDLGVHPKP